MAKYKIGDELFFMKKNKPVKATIKGIIKYGGTCDIIPNKKNVPVGKVLVEYFFSNRATIEEKNLYLTNEELMNSVFPKTV